MYLRGSKLKMNRRRRRSSPITILILAVLIGGAIYVNQIVVPRTEPLFIPTATPTRSPESYINEAEKLLADGKISQAIDVYKSASIVSPDNPAIYLSIAKLEIMQSHFNLAVENAGNALVVNPNNAQALALRGYALGLQGDYLEAESSLNQAINLDPNNPVPYAYLSEVLALKSSLPTGDLETLNRAVDYSRKAESLGPGLLETHRARGIVLELTSNYEEAVAEFSAAIAINPNIADLHIYLGRNYRTLGDYPNAIREFNNAIPLNPTDPLPYQYLSRTYATQGEYANAIQYAELAVERNPTDPTLYGNLGVMYYRNHDYPKAIANLKLAVRGGTAETGEIVEGLPLDYWPVSEYYYMYGLALARTQNCSEALPIAQVVLDGVSTEETSVSNAQEIINICEQVASGEAPTFEPSATP